MCNLYTYKLSRDEIRGLMQHYKLIDTEWAEQFEKEMLGKNDEALVYPKYRAPVVIVRAACDAPETCSGRSPCPTIRKADALKCDEKSRS